MASPGNRHCASCIGALSCAVVACRSLALQSGDVWRHGGALVLGGGAGAPTCVHLDGLSAGQRRLCQLYPDHMASVARGARAGVAECQHQLDDRRWNCSTHDNDSSLFGPVLNAGASLHAASFSYS